MRVIDIQYTIEQFVKSPDKPGGKWVLIPIKIAPSGQPTFSTQKGGLAHRKIRQLAGMYEKIRLIKTVKTIEASYE